MSNEILHKRIVIELDVWSPFKHEAEADIDHLLNLKKERKLLSHCGNVKITIEG